MTGATGAKEQRERSHGPRRRELEMCRALGELLLLAREYLLQKRRLELFQEQQGRHLSQLDLLQRQPFVAQLS